MVDKKQSPKGKTIRVTFELPAEIAEDSIAVVGDFNDWNPDMHPMALNPKKGVWSKSISFKPGGSHEFRYFNDGIEWRNDEEADRYVPNPYFCENSVLEV